MIRFPSTRHKNFRLPQRTEPTALDKERNFLTHIVGQSLKKKASREVEGAVGIENRYNPPRNASG